MGLHEATVVLSSCTTDGFLNSTFLFGNTLFRWRRSQWPRGLMRRSAATRLLRLWVRIPPGAWMFVCCEFCVCCQVEVSATGWSLVYRRPTDCGASIPLIIFNQLWLNLKRRYIAGCNSCMRFAVTVNTIAECLRTDCNILGNKQTKNSMERCALTLPLSRIPPHGYFF